MSKTILAIDLGFGYNKVIVAQGDKIINKFKFPSVVGLVNKNKLITDSRIFSYDNKDYYVGEESLKLQTSSIIDIHDYKTLEYYAPLFIYSVCNQMNITPDIITTGLSKAHISQSGYFEEKIKSFEVNGVQINNKSVYVLPQGAGSKLTIDKYGSNFPTATREFMGNSSYTGVDIGFNTIDLFQVINGKASPNLFEGVEDSGVVRIARSLVQFVKDKDNRDITLNEAKDILQTNTMKVRDKIIDYSEKIAQFKSEYLAYLLQLVEEKYGSILDKMDNLYLIGGGSYLFTDNSDSFIKVPNNDNEYYNVIGFYLYALKQVQ